jgi:hypothetical protein
VLSLNLGAGFLTIEVDDSGQRAKNPLLPAAVQGILDPGVLSTEPAKVEIHSAALPSQVSRAHSPFPVGGVEYHHGPRKSALRRVVLIPALPILAVITNP